VLFGVLGPIRWLQFEALLFVVVEDGRALISKHRIHSLT
jgi:hypothetical protein